MRGATVRNVTSISLSADRVVDTISSAAVNDCHGDGSDSGKEGAAKCLCGAKDLDSGCSRRRKDFRGLSILVVVWL